MCDLDLQPTQINVSNGTTTPQGERLYKIILKSMHKCGSYGLDNLIYMYVTFKCDIDLQPTYMQKCFKGTSPPHGQQLRQIVLKSIHKCRSYG